MALRAFLLPKINKLCQRAVHSEIPIKHTSVLPPPDIYSQISSNLRGCSTVGLRARLNGTNISSKQKCG